MAAMFSTFISFNPLKSRLRFREAVSNTARVAVHVFQSAKDRVFSSEHYRAYLTSSPIDSFQSANERVFNSEYGDKYSGANPGMTFQSANERVLISEVP